MHAGRTNGWTRPARAALLSGKQARAALLSGKQARGAALLGLVALIVSGVAVLAPIATPRADAAPAAAAVRQPASPNAPAATVVTGNEHACALVDYGRVKCWGDNGLGQLGLGDKANRGDTPGEMGQALPVVNLGAGRTATALAAGQEHTCALLDNGRVKCWGKGAKGQLGNGANTLAVGDSAAEMGDNLPYVDLGTGRTATAIAAGFDHTCAILDNGALKCWGDGGAGQLGYGNTANRGDGPGEMGDNLPAVDLGTGRTAVAVAVGKEATTCALLDNGQVKCWGFNFVGQLGLGDTNDRGDGPGEMGDNLPAVDLGTGRTATAIAAGGRTNCAILDNATTKCWGAGVLGIGDQSARGDGPGEMGDNLPIVNLGTGRTATSISAGADHQCAVLDNGGLKCWGANGAGQLGLGDTNTRGGAPGEMGDALPAVDRPSASSEVSSGHLFTCVRAAVGDVVSCWGRSARGELGIGETANRGDGPGEMGNNLPITDLTTLTISITADESTVAVGEAIHYHVVIEYGGSGAVTGTSVAVTAPGVPECAQSRPDLPRPSRQTYDCTHVATEADVGAFSLTATVDAAETSPAASKAAVVTVVRPLTTQLTADEFSVAPGGTIHYHLTLTSHATATTLTGITVTDTDAPACAGPVADIAPGASRTVDCAYTTTAADFPLHRHRATVDSDQTDPAPSNTLRVRVGAAGASVVGGSSYSCAILPSGRVKCWGGANSGALGYGDLNTRGDSPADMGVNLRAVDLGTGRTAVALAGGAVHVCALLDNARVKCWGEAGEGQLGQGDTNDRGDGPGEMGDNLPYVDLGTGRTALAISAPTANTTGIGGRHTCALLDNGQVKCWGLNGLGQLGLGDNANRGDGPGEMGDALPAVDLGTGRTAVAIAASSFHTCAILDNGTVKCWGASSVGELGLGTGNTRGDGPGEMGDNLPTVNLGTGRTARAIVAGGAQTCVTLDNDAVKCWGYNGTGALGLGDGNNRGDNAGEMGDNLPALDFGAGRTAVTISLGTDYGCALLDDGATKCWGRNNSGNLGYGDTAVRGDNPGEMGDNLPAVDLGAGRSAVALGATLLRTCALLDDRSIKCWGSNSSGELGLGDTNTRGDNPSEMGDNLPAVDLGSLSLVVTAQEATVGVGGTIHYQVSVFNDGGTPRTGITLSAPAVPGCAPAVPDLASGASHAFSCTHTVVQSDTGTFNNTVTIDSDQTAPAAASPAVVIVPIAVRAVLSADEPAVSPGTPIHYHLALTNQAAVTLTGLTVTDANAPACNGPLPDLAPNATQTVHCAFTPAAAHYPSRANAASVDADQLDPITSNSVSVQVGTPLRATRVVAGDDFSCALLEGGAVRCWGNGANGRLGSGNTAVVGDDEIPGSVGTVDLGAGRTATAIAAGAAHVCVVLDNGTVRCWGPGTSGRLGYGNTASIGDNETPGSVGPVDLGAGRTATAITAADSHTCAILDNGAVRCWGLGTSGRLGYGNTTAIGDNEAPGSVGPVDLGAGRTAVAISAGLNHTCAVLDNGAARCWGAGANGRLGYGNTTTIGDNEAPGSVGPVDLGAERTAVQIVAGPASTCAILDNGAVRCWGYNGDGRLGYANTSNIGDDETPGSVGTVDLGEGRTATGISMGGVGVTTTTVSTTDSTTCAILDNGGVRCWGTATNGRLGNLSSAFVGNDETPGSVAPVDLGAGRTATRIASGDNHTCVILDTGRVRCWGLGTSGRLGYANTATIGDDEAPSAAGPVDLGVGPGDPTLGVSVAADETSVMAGETVHLHVTVTNLGVPPLSGLTLSVPAAPDCEDPIDDLAAGAHQTIDCTYTTDGDDVGTLSVTVTADSAQTAPVASSPAHVTVTAPPPAALTAELTADQSTVVAGADIDYHLTVTNTGGVAATGIAVTDAAAPTCAGPIADLAPGAHHTVDCTYRTRSGDFGTYSNTASVDSAQTDPVDSNTVPVTVTAPAGSGVVSGTVAESGSGTALEGMLVSVLSASDFSPVGLDVTDGAGHYAAAVPAGDYFVFVLDPTGTHVNGFAGAPDRLTVTAGATIVTDPTLASTRGTVSGTIHDDTTLGPLADVAAMTVDLVTGQPGAGAVTGVDGHYTVSGLRPGPRLLRYVDLTGGHLPEFHDDAVALEDVDIVNIVGATTVGADAGLATQPTPVGGAHLTGVVTEQGSGAPLEGVVVLAVHASDLSLAVGGRSGPGGAFDLTVDPGDYKLAYYDPTGAHLFEWFDGRTTSELAAAASVTAAGTPGTADASMVISTGGVAGTVTADGTGDPLNGLLVVAINPTGTVVGATITAGDGTYAITGLAQGTVKLRFVDPAGTYTSEYHHDSTIFETATPVTITNGTTASVDAGLTTAAP